MTMTLMTSARTGWESRVAISCLVAGSTGTREPSPCTQRRAHTHTHLRSHTNTLTHTGRERGDYRQSLHDGGHTGGGDALEQEHGRVSLHTHTHTHTHTQAHTGAHTQAGART